jgi:enoyl-CoA hydratase
MSSTQLSATDAVRFETVDQVAVITLAAPERRNALTPEMIGALLEACERIDRDTSIGAALLRSLGPAFCAGADRQVLRRVGEDPFADSSKAFMSGAHECFARISELSVPSIVAVRGHAVGAGVNLAFSADLRVVATDATLLAGFANIGIHPGGGHFGLITRTAGREIAAAMGLFALPLSGQRAAEIGAAFEAVPENQVEDRALELAGRAAADPELSRAVVATMRRELGPPTVGLRVAIDLENAAQLWSLRRVANGGPAGPSRS